MKRLVLVGLVVILGIGLAGFAIDPNCFQKTPCACFIGNIQIDYNAGTIQFQVYRWSYVYIFGFNTRLGIWEAVRPRVSSEVRNYPPGCHTICIGNGKIRQFSYLVFIATERPCLVYPDPPIQRPPFAHEIYVRGCCGRMDVVKLRLCPPAPCYSYCPRPERITYQSCCPLPCNPCTFLMFLLLLAIGN